jgi:hypothetical protein
MSLIDKTYFKMDINLPASNFTDLSNYVSTYEPEILRLLLGEDLYQLVNAFILSNPTASSQAVQDLVLGKEYTVDIGLASPSKVKWNGLINTSKISIISYYIYYWYMRNKVSLTTTTGEVKSSYENATRGAVANKVNNSWRRLQKLYGFVDQSLIIPSAYNFLYEHESDYPEWIFTPLKSTNAFDL